MATPPAPAPASAPDAAEIERLTTQANVCHMVADLAGEVQAYAKLVERRPADAGFRAKLATLMARWPPTLRQAERQFVEAVRLDADNAELHYEFGLHYRAIRIPSRAIAEFRTALRLDPHHEKARAQLEAGAPRDQMLAVLKKLF